MPTRKPANPKASAPPPAKPGRPAYVPTDKDRGTVRLMVSGGITYDRIAALLGISESTLERHFKSDIAMGKAEIDALSIRTVVSVMREGGRDGLTAAMWWQKSRMGWSEKPIAEDTLANVPLHVIIELVGSPAPAQVTQREAPRSIWKAPPDIQLIG
jgi:DNA-binding CsgD family transcriptional regulator